MSATLALQTAIRAALIGNVSLTDLVPASNIVDQHGLPAFPQWDELDGIEIIERDTGTSIIIGEAEEIPLEDTLEDNRFEVFFNLHIWAQEDHLTGVKEIAHHVHTALRELGPVEGYRTVRSRYTGARYMRDPTGKHAHAIVNFAAKLEPLQ